MTDQKKKACRSESAGGIGGRVTSALVSMDALRARTTQILTELNETPLGEQDPKVVRTMQADWARVLILLTELEGKATDARTRLEGSGIDFGAARHEVRRRMVKFGRRKMGVDGVSSRAE